MLLLLIGCGEVPAPAAAPSPSTPGLSITAPQPASILELSSPHTPRLAFHANDGITILTTEGALVDWSPPEEPRVRDLPPLVDLTHSSGRLYGLSIDGGVLIGAERVETDHGGDGLLSVDRDSALIAVLQDGLRVVDPDSLEVLWEARTGALSGITIGGGLVFDYDATQLLLTARDARTGDVQASRSIRPPHRSSARGSQPRRSLEELTPQARASMPGAPRTLQELREALYYDPTTDRLFFRQLVLDGRTLESLGRIPGIDGVLYADQGRIIARRQGWDGTISVMLIDPTALTIEGRVPLLRPEGEPHIFYDPVTAALTLSEPGRQRLLRWEAPLTAP